MNKPKGVTYAEIARECMVEVSTVYQWFNKGRVPGAMSQKILADKFGIIYENQAKGLDKS